MSAAHELAAERLRRAREALMLAAEAVDAALVEVAAAKYENFQTCDTCPTPAAEVTRG